MRVWTKVQPFGAVKVLHDSAHGFKNSMKIYAWDSEDIEIEQGIAVATVYGLIKAGKTEIRVQYEKEDYEKANKSNLLILRAVKEARKGVEEQLMQYLDEL